MGSKLNNKLLLKYRGLSTPLRASIWFLLCSFLQKTISVMTIPIFTRLMTTSEYGQYNVFISWQGIATVFITLNLSWGVYSQGLVKFEHDRRIFSSSMQSLTLFLVSIWAIVYLFTRDIWNELFSVTTYQMAAMFIIIWTGAVFEFWAAEQRVDYKYRNLILITLLSTIVNPGVGITLVSISKDKVSARIIGLAVTSFILCIGLFFSQIRNGKKLYSKKYWRYALEFNIPLVPHYLSQTVLNSADRIMIEKMVSVEAAGIYGLAYSASMIMTLFNAALMQTISPWIYKKIKEKREDEIKEVAYPALILIAIVNILLIAFAPEAVAFLAPKSYYDAIWIIPPVAMSAYFMFAYDLFAKFEFYFEKTKWITVATVCGALLNVGLNYIFIRIFDYYAAGYTTLVCYMMYAIFHYICMNKIYKKERLGKGPYRLKELCLITGCFLLIGFIFLFSYYTRVIRYFLIIVWLLILWIKRKVLFGILEKYKHRNF